MIINAHNFTPPTLTGIWTSAPTTGNRNNLTGTLGFRFSAARTFSLQALGRFVAAGMASNHTLNLWSDAGSLLASVVITPSSELDALGWRYERLSSPITLTSGEFYRLASNEVNGGDNWKEQSVVPFNTSDIANVRAFFGLSLDAFPSFGANVGQAYANPQLYY